MPQGNSPSPLQYNFCEQIAILNLELDPRIASINNHHLIPRYHVPPILGPDVLLQARVLDPVPIPALVHRPAQPIEFLPGVANIDRNAINLPLLPDDPFALESNRETDKVESFADDKTVIFLATEAGLSAIREILSQFENFSGLLCNMDKSVLMYIGVDTPPPAFLNNFEFKLVDKIKILGIEISSNPSLLHLCHKKMVLKITQIISFWERFFLSLPGRINIAKTMILTNKLSGLYNSPQ